MPYTSAAVQEATYIHCKLQDDIAYKYSVDNKDAFNMRLVLRAYGEKCSTEAAELQIETATTLTC